MAKVNVKFNLNGKDAEASVEPNARLLDVLREDFKLTGTKEGCGEGDCGACTIMIDGKTVNSCLVLAASVEGKKVTTIEGLAEDDMLHPIQDAFIEEGAVQCGFCTPGMIMSAKAVLDEDSNPTRDKIMTSISGNLCRCTGYSKIANAIQRAAKVMNQD